MKKQLLFLILCISLLLSGCQKTPEEPPAVQAEKAPWETGLPDTPPSYAEYFAETWILCGSGSGSLWEEG